jgi:hypothetical protein
MFRLWFQSIFSLSNYSSGGFSNKSSLNDSGVVGDQEMDSVSEDKLRLQVNHFIILFIYKWPNLTFNKAKLCNYLSEDKLRLQVNHFISLMVLYVRQCDD